jgi:hypothetical protein
MNGVAGTGSKSSPSRTLSPVSANVSGPLPLFVTRNSNASFVAPAVTATVGLCSATATFTVSATISDVVFELADAGTPLTE